jgi:hypothetical protein
MIRYRGVTSFTKYNSLGEQFAVYREEPLMPRIDDRFLDCSIYLYQSEDEARAGVSSGGSGFLAAIPGYGRDWQLEGRCPQPDFYHCYAVTNAHVAQKSPVVRLNRVATSTTGSRVSVIPLTAADWTESTGHDIAVAPIPYAEGNRYFFIASTAFLTQGIATANDVGIGDETFMVGRFINHEGKQQNNPSVRWGHVSMMPVEVVDDPADPKAREMCFAVEMRSLPGYSGSPVFVRPFSTPKLISRPHFIVPDPGTNTAVYAERWPVDSVPAGPWLLGIQSIAVVDFVEHKGVKHNTGMCGAIPAWHILDLLNTEKMRLQRKQEQELLRERYERSGTTET